MNQEPKTLHFGGSMFINPKVDGVFTGAIGPLEVDKLEIKPDADKRTIPSKKAEGYGNSRKTYYTGKPAIITIATNEVPPILFAAAFMGEQVTINQGSGSKTDLAVTLPAYPAWAELPNTNLGSEGLTVTGPSAASLVVGVDVEVNYALGLIRATKGGAVKAGGAITMGYSYNAVTGTRTKGNLKPAIEAKVTLDGKNLIDGTRVKVTVPLASLSPKNAVDFMSEKAIDITLEGELMIAFGEDAPYYVDELETTV
jgi:hypothetical protein